jgi:hypothetical protein
MLEELDDLLSEMPGDEASEAEIEAFMEKVAARPGGLEWIREWAEAIAGQERSGDSGKEGTAVLRSPLRFVFRVERLGSKPVVWRRFSAPADLNFRQLHEMIEAAFGRGGRADYEFEVLEEGQVVVSIGPSAGHYDDQDFPVMNLFQESVGEFLYCLGEETLGRHRVVIENLVGEGMAGTSVGKEVHFHDGAGKVPGPDAEE